MNYELIFIFIGPLQSKPDQQHLQPNDRAMISQICNVKPEDVATIRSNKPLVQLEIDYLNVILREKASLV